MAPRRAQTDLPKHDPARKAIIGVEVKTTARETQVMVSGMGLKTRSYGFCVDRRLDPLWRPRCYGEADGCAGRSRILIWRRTSLSVAAVT